MQLKVTGTYYKCGFAYLYSHVRFLLAHGKNLLLFLIFSMVTRGPLANTLENFNRAARSVACGAELAMNQSRQLVERVSAPLRREWPL